MRKYRSTSNVFEDREMYIDLFKIKDILVVGNDDLPCLIQNR